MLLNNKRVIITGASEGLGKTLSFLLAEHGAHVVLLARTEKKLRTVESEIKKHKGNVTSFCCDISKLSEVKKTVQEITQSIGAPDILINNAGIWTDNNLDEKNPIKRQDVFNVNAVGTIQLTEAFLPFFKEKNVGHIVNVISTSGTQDTLQGDNKFWKTYGATKWAIAGYTNALQSELQQTHIKITGFYPGGINTNFYANAGDKRLVDQPWMISTKDIADIILFLVTRPDDVLVEKLVVTKKL